ncbi:MAG: hypothetical protein OYK82_12300 [Gammaproteobacteria bacterium]|nr:hypothetical protein [Gammaproteobacteria bacterium]
MSVGTHRRVRDLTPVEVASYYAKAIRAGASKVECAQATQFRVTTMVDRFLRLLKLPQRLKHFVEWGRSGKGVIGFSGAVELTLFPCESQMEMGLKIVEHELTKKEIVSVRQLFERSPDPLGGCVQRVLGRRPVVKHVEVILGSIDDEELRVILRGYSQRERNDVVWTVVRELVPAASITSARLGTSSFSIVGPRGVVAQLDELTNPEILIQDAVRRHVGSKLGAQQ